MEKESGKEVTWEEAMDAGYRLVGLAELAWDFYIEEQSWKERLKKEPEGFSLSGNGRNCAICGESTREDTNWYDKWGIKCLTCQNAVNKRKIPGSVAKTDNNRYSPYDLESRFGIKKPTLRKMIKDRIIKARPIMNDSGTVHYYVILVKDNKEFLPPKKLTESHVVAEDRDGQTWHRIEPWYKFCDPHEHLKGYQIMNYLQFVEKTE